MDIYNNKILNYNYNYYPSNINNKVLLSNLNKTRDLYHKQSMYNINNGNINFMFSKYQKELITHNSNTNSRLFENCIYSLNYNGELGCNEKNKNLNADYFKNQQNKNLKIIKSIQNDINYLI